MKKTKEELSEILRKHKMWVNGEKGREMADLREADLSGADLREADLDYSCLPLWCGGQFKADERICKQLVAHVVRIMELSEIDNPELIEKMNEYKKGWHREGEF
jgi:hypothetical protein